MNKAIVLELAKQIASVGGDPQDALKSGTFAPGQIGDPTGAGNTCDDANDPVGCIFTQNLLVPDATADEINAVSNLLYWSVWILDETRLQAVSGVSAGDAGAAASTVAATVAAAGPSSEATCS